MSLQNLHNVFLSAQSDCDAIIASSVQGVVSDAFRAEYSKKVKTVSSFSPYKEIRWLSGNAVVEFTTSRTNKRIFFPSVGFFVAAKLVPLYKELLEYRNAVVAMLQANGTSIENEEDNNGNVSQGAIQMVDAYAGFTMAEKDWVKKFLAEKKSSPVQWWGKGKEIKRANDFFVSPLMKCAKLNAETQGEIADVAKQLASDSALYSLLSAGPIVTDSGADNLCVALRLFQQHRATKQISPWSSFDAYAKAVRSEFELVDESLVGSQGFDYGVYMRKYAITPTVANAQFAGHSTDVQKAVLKFLHDEKNAPHDAAWYIDENNRPKHNGANIAGFGPTATVFFMMELRPEKFATWSKMVFDSLRDLGLYVGQTPTVLTQESYEYSFAQQVLLKSKMKEMGIGKAADDQSDADFLTVNEFLWFVSENFKEIQNEVMNMSLETPTNATNAGNKDWSDVLSSNPDDMMNRLVAALLTKPFAILAGASGTGKSRMVRKLAYMTCLNTQLQPDPQTKKPIENFRMVQVKPNWHDSSDLLGYRSSVSGTHDYVSTDFVRFILKAHAFPNTPFFVCLDEMNLAPVEHYFAEFLSASESARVEDGEYITDPIIDPGEFYGNIANLDPQGYSIPQARKDLIEKLGLYLPKNLFVVGTVNMDDTTGGFSRKVLDRAMTLEMNEVNFDELQSPVELRLMDKVENGQVVEKGLLLKAQQIASFIDRVDFKPVNFDNSFKAQLEDIRGKLAVTTLAFAYRFARECVQYRDALKTLFPNVAGGTQYDHGGFALDHMFLMKILPRLVGNVDDRQLVVNTLNAFFGTLTGHGLSAKKLHDMLEAAKLNGGFLSYYL